MTSSMPVGIVGGGPWGVALALAASRAGAPVTLHTRRAQSDRAKLPKLTTDYAEVTRAPLIVLAVPSNTVRAVLRSLGDHLDGRHLVVHGIRGLGLEHLETISDIIRQETAARRIGALGGPVQAAELTEARPSAMVCGSRFGEVLAAVTGAFQSSSLRVYTTPDLRGLEWASAIVGCVAIGVGFAEQAGAGPGLIAALISRAIEESARLAAAAGAEERTMFGLGGVGDLLASVALADRPEVVLGKALAQGHSVEQATEEARLRVEALPLIPRIAAFARERKVPARTFQALEDILAGVRPERILAKLFAP